MLQTLARWNRWGTARLDPGVARDAAAEMRPFLDTPEVVALAGPRRAGKTTLLYQLMDAVEAAGAPPEACLHVNFEEPGLGPELGLALLDRIYETYRTEVRPNGRAYLFLDEIQHVPSWERLVRARKETEDVKLFVTGSSSALMTREFGSLLTGRHVTFRVWPLGFGEFLRFKSIAAPRRPKLAGSPAPMLNALGEFMRWGGFPEVVLAEDEARKEALLKQDFGRSALQGRGPAACAARRVDSAQPGRAFPATPSACLVSYQRLARSFGVSLDLTRAYCGHLQEAFLVDFLPYFSLKAAERRRRPQKVHAVDVGLRRVVSLSASEDRGGRPRPWSTAPSFGARTTASSTGKAGARWTSWCAARIKPRTWFRSSSRPANRRCWPANCGGWPTRPRTSPRRREPWSWLPASCRGFDR